MGSDSVIILGAGLTGLCAAVALKRFGVPVKVLESSSRAGGAVQTERAGGFLFEHGPNSMMTGDAEIEAFLREIGLQDEIVHPRCRKRFLVRDGKAVALPSGPVGAVTTSLFSLRGKLRVLREPFIPLSRAKEESLADLVSRRLGPEVLWQAIEPFVAGIYAGDPEKLSARHAFPKLWQLERDHGSFIRGALRKRRDGAPQKMISFREGMGVLPSRLAALLGDDLRIGARIESIGREGGGWSIAWREPSHSRQVCCSSFVCAVPAFAVPGLPWSDTLGGQLGFLSRVDYPPVGIVALAFPRACVSHPLDGFGVLVPARERTRILGTIFSSSLFADRAPEGNVLLTTFVGGARQPDLVSLPDDAMEKAVHDDLGRLLGVRGEPVFRRVIRWPRAIPQYNIGHGEVVAALEKLEAAHAGLHFVGNYRGGIAAGQCIRNGLRLAQEIIAKNKS